MGKHIDLVPCYSDRALYLSLAKDYIAELSTFDKKIIWDEQAILHLMWNAFFIMEDRTVQGFIVTEEVQFKVFEDLLYIEEFYIVPEARHRGLGVRAVKAAVSRWHGDVFLYILERNYAAQNFWLVVERELGWERIQRPEIRQEKGCELMVYKTS